MKLPRFLPLIALASLTALPFQAEASLLVYENFNYSGTVSNGSTMNGVATAATGLTGAYAVSNTGTGSTTFRSSGLSFSNFLSSAGGAITLSTSLVSGTGGLTIAGAQLNTGTVTGTIWSSYLANFTSLSYNTNAVAGERINTSATTGGGTASFGALPDSGDSLNKLGVNYDSTVSTYSGSTTLTINTTYLVVSRFTNAGSALTSGSPGVATSWLFTQSAYDSWQANGATEILLSTYASATISDSVTSGTYTFGNSKYIQFANYAGNSNAGASPETMIVDELRYGTSLSDVVAIPEPSALLLTALAAGFILIFRHRSATH